MSTTASILAQIKSAAYATSGTGSFINPDDSLPKFLLGEGASIEDLKERTVTEFYVIPEQRNAFLARLRVAQGKPVNDYVLLRLHDGLAWCRCRSIWSREDSEDRYTGIIVRLEPDDDWAPGRLLARMGYAYLRINKNGQISYASDFAAEKIGASNAFSLISKPFSTTHWWDEVACGQFLEEAWAYTPPTRQQQFNKFVEFKHAGHAMRVHLQSRVRQKDIGEASVLEVVWRDISEEEARLAALELREKVERLENFEQETARVVANAYKLGLGAFYRFHPDEKKYILRAEYGFEKHNHEEQSLPPRVHNVEPDSTNAINSFLSTKPWADDASEFLIPIDTPSNERIGCLWIPITRSDTDISWVKTFAKYLGEVVHGAESQAAQRASDRTRDEAVRFLLSADPSNFYQYMVDTLKAEVCAEAASIFAVEQRDNEKRLVLKWSTGIKEIDKSRWSDVTYRFGEGLTGKMAERNVPLSLLNVSAERDFYGPPRFNETVQNKPVSWLGCPVNDERGNLIAYIRLVNHRVGTNKSTPPAGFSEGDRAIVSALARVASQFFELQASLSNHHHVIAQSFHELSAPLVAIRTHADYSTRLLNSKANRTEKITSTKVKWTNVQIDSELLLNLLESMELATHDRVPRLQPTRLYGEVIVPSLFGLREVAKRWGYMGLDVEVNDIQKLPILRTDVGMMRQVFYNLITNAIKYGPSDKNRSLSVDISASTTSKTCSILVRDWGMGIAPEHSGRIFDRHYRAGDATIRDPLGSGIGLFVVRKILQKHRGAIHVSKLSNPTEFTISLPRE